MYLSLFSMLKHRRKKNKWKKDIPWNHMINNINQDQLHKFLYLHNIQMQKIERKIKTS